MSDMATPLDPKIGRALRRWLLMDDPSQSNALIKIWLAPQTPNADAVARIGATGAIYRGTTPTQRWVVFDATREVLPTIAGFDFVDSIDRAGSDWA